MLTAVWSGLGSKVADRWADLLVSPALGFWLVGLVAWTWRNGGVGGGATSGWAAVAGVWADVGSSGPAAQVTVVVVLLLVVAASAKVADALTLAVLRLLEGYWPAGLEGLRTRRVLARSRRLDADARTWREMFVRREGLTAAELHRLRRVESRRATSPADPTDRTPTRLGDLLRAMETRPRHRYGLDAVVVFPHLWFVLPEQVRGDLGAARQRLDEAARLWLWGVLTCGWVVLAWWAPVLGIGTALIAYRLALSAAAGYAQLVQACFDLYRGTVYAQTGRTVPTDPDAERVAGRELTAVLARGPRRGQPVTPSSSP